MEKNIIEDLKEGFVKDNADNLEQRVKNTNTASNKDNIVVFLDLLGFTNCVGKSFQTAVSKLKNYNTTIALQFQDQKLCPVNSYSPELKKLAEANYATTFDYFLPASDSVFIASDKDNLNVFIKQLCSFLFKSYHLTASSYANPEDKEEATLQKEWSLSSNGQNDVYNSPCLFRGGMAIGICNPLNQFRVVNGKIAKDNCNLVGKAIAEAAHLEGVVNGPRVLIEEKYYNMCDSDVKNHYFRKLTSHDLKEEYRNKKDKNGNKIIYYELLWPVTLFIRENGIMSEIRNNVDLHDFIQGAYNLYKSKSNKGAEKHYKAFIELIYNSILIYWNNAVEAQDFVYEYISGHDHWWEKMINFNFLKLWLNRFFRKLGFVKIKS